MIECFKFFYAFYMVFHYIAVLNVLVAVIMYCNNNKENRG